MLRSLSLAAGLLLVLPVHAQVFKCVDAQGKTVYSQAPCPSGATSKKIDVPPPAAPRAERADKGEKGKPAAKGPKSAEQDFRKRQTEREEADKKEAETQAKAQEKQEGCTRARAGLAQIEAGGRLSRFNEKGEREILDDGQVAQERARAQANVQKWCSS